MPGSDVQKKATIDGVLLELEIVKQKLENAHEQMRRVIGMHQTLQAEFQQFRTLWATQLNGFVNGGPTQRLDSGTDDQPSD